MQPTFPLPEADALAHSDQLAAALRAEILAQGGAMPFSRFMELCLYTPGWGYYSAIVPKEVMESGAKDWKKVNGTGPYALTNYVQGNAMTFTKNPSYWASETIGGESYKLPFADTITYRYIKDESTALTALTPDMAAFANGFRRSPMTLADLDRLAMAIEMAVEFLPGQRARCRQTARCGARNLHQFGLHRRLPR